MSVRFFQPPQAMATGIQAAFSPLPVLNRLVNTSTTVEDEVAPQQPSAGPGELLWSPDPALQLARSALAFGKDGPAFEAYPMKMTPLLDTAESRSAQRSRVRSLIEKMMADKVPDERIAFMRARLEIAARFELMILDSGNLYFKRQYLRDPELSADGLTLTGFDNADRRVTIPVGGKKSGFRARSAPTNRDYLAYSHEVYVGGAPATFHYHLHLDSAAVFIGRGDDEALVPATPVEVGDTIANLPEVPTDYLERIQFLKQPDWKRFTLPQPTRTRVDFASVNAEDDVPKNRREIAVDSYTFTIDGHAITVQLPAANSKLTVWQRKRGYYIPDEKDLPTLLKVLLQLVPASFFPHELTVMFLSFGFKGDTVAQVDGHTMMFGGAKAGDLDKWLKKTLLWALQHEAAHIFQDSNKTINTLIYRCMLLDGWTTDYSQDHIQEYFAVLASDFFESPQLARNFPNGFRLLHALIQMRQNGVTWGEEIQDEALAKLGQGCMYDRRSR